MISSNSQIIETDEFISKIDFVFYFDHYTSVFPSFQAQLIVCKENKVFKISCLIVYAYSVCLVLN